MPFVFAQPYMPPPAPPKMWNRMVLQWRGWDGSVWDISHWRSGAFITQAGIEGLGRPVHEDWLAPQSPAMHGQEHAGEIVRARDVFWPIYLYADGSSREWQERDSAFWKSLRRGKVGQWSVTTTAGTRTLDCRYKSGGEAAYERDPHAFGWARYGISLIADDPFWKGDPITRSWRADDSQDFFGGTGKAPLFHISSASQFGTATISNPGDVAAWPVWEIKGPAENIAVGFGNRQVTYPGALLEGQTLTIDTDPLDQTAWINGVDVTDDLGRYSFASIPAGEDVKIWISMQGTGVVSATITPRFDGAW